MNAAVLRPGASVRLVLSWLLPFVACVPQWVFQDVLARYPWFFMYQAVVAALFLGGVWGGVGATLIGAALVATFFLPQPLSLAGDPGALYTTLIFVLFGVGFSLLYHRLRTAEEGRILDSALQTNDERLRHAIEAANEGIWEVNLVTHEAFANDRWLALLGYGPGEAQPSTELWAKTIHSEDSPLALHALEEFQRGSTAVYDLEYRVVTRGGEVRWLHGRGTVAERDPAGRPVRLVGTVGDITDRKLAELQLRDSEERFRLVVENSPNPLLIWDETGALRYISPAVSEELGFSSEAMFHDNDLLRPLIEQGDAVEFTPQLLAALGARNSRNPHSWYNILRAVQYCLQHPGEKVRIEGSVETSFGVRDLQGVLQGFRRSTTGAEVVGIAHDVTELRQLQRMLQETNAALEQRVVERTAEVQDLYDNAPAGYHSVDASGRVIMVNQTLLNWLGYSREEVVGRLSVDFLTPESKARYASLQSEFVRQGHIYDMEFDAVRKDGSLLPIRVHARAFYGDDGSYQFARATVFDATERKRTEETARLAALEMERALRLKDEFLATMSHELRTPLNGVLTLCEALQFRIYGDLTERQQRALSHIESSGRHLLDLINDVLDLSKIAADKLELDLEQVALDSICQASLLFAKEIAYKKQIKLEYDNQQPDLYIYADARRLKQMLVNLLNNAIKFTPPGGSVELSVAVDAAASAVRLSVQDTGIGIKPEDQARLFQPFTQIDSRLVREYEGTGLGLALVKRLATQHGGSVSISSTGVPGEGSCFTIVLPITSLYVPPGQGG